MARTAPAPNMIATPGMNPGNIVAGGGGGAGGGSGGKGKGGGGDGDASAEGGGEDASGGGKEGEGSEGCGDPICPVTGRMFLDILDFAFPGPLPLRFMRSYSSRTSHIRGDLGFGWSHAFNWRLRMRRRTVVLVDDGGREQKLPKPPDDGTEVGNGFAWKLRKTPSGFEIWLPKRERRLVFSLHAVEGVHHQVAEIDRHGNRTELQRDEAGLLVGIVDSAGRPYRVLNNALGLIEQIQVPRDAQYRSWLTLVRYEYDANANLIAVTDAENHTKRMYYVGHLLVEHRLPCGLSYCYVYDGRTHDAKCVESWGEYIGSVDPALEHPLPPRPSSGPDLRSVKGINYVKLTYADGFYTEVVNGLGAMDRYFGDPQGRVVKHVDAVGRVVERTFDPITGSLASETGAGSPRTAFFDDRGGPLGFELDGKGLRVFADGDGTVVYYDERNGKLVRRRFDANDNLVYIGHDDGTTEHFEYDPRGLVIASYSRNGGLTRFHHDAMGNLVHVDTPQGERISSEYDYLGRRTRYVDRRGEVTEWVWDDLNEIIQKTHPDGSTLQIVRDSNGKPTLVNAAGQTWSYRYGGLGWLIEITNPQGATTQLRYDVEGNLTLVENARGQQYNQRFDVVSRPIGANTFEDVELSGDLDLDGHLVTSHTPLGKTVCEYDSEGNLVLVEYADGTTVALEHVVGMGPSRIDNGVALVECTYDGVGQVIEDVQGDHRSKIAWVGGHVGTIESDRGLLVTETKKAGTHEKELVVGSVRAELRLKQGRDWLAHFGEHFSLRKHFGPTGLLEYQVLARRDRGTAIERVATTEDPNVLWWARYEYGADQCVRSETDSSGRRIEYTVNVLGQVTEQRTFRGQILERTEDVRYDAAGTPRAAGVIFDHFARPVSVGNDAFEYDAEGRLVRRVTPDGAWDYEWSAGGCLSCVRAPSHRVEMDYDGRGRRIRRRLFREGLLIEKTSYLWANQVVLHEIDELTGRTRTYMRENDVWEPYGHVDAVAGVERFCLYLQDGAGALICAFDEGGGLVFDGHRSVFGAYEPSIDAAAISVRFVNQHYDPAVGFVYNRFRWYQPETGLFISRDPIELDGNLNPRDYVPNPRRQIDPLGLAMIFTDRETQPDGHGHPTRPALPGEMTNDETAAYLRQPGHFATNGTEDTPGYVVADDTERTGRGFRSQTERTIDAAGDAYGCHSCGRKRKEIEETDGKFGHWRKDHQPPLQDVEAADALARRNGQPLGTVRIYPHCPRCSNTQGGLLASRPPTGQDASNALSSLMAGRSEDSTRRGPARR